ncbi:MAG: RNA polymerase sigma factor [Butyrivibrio sp.]|nr:RNA polymerase sigma factor [Muribaculum sp.]MCM1553840.1 RNA polymerase sigma factor [Butyrivibrio sp.]
MNCNRKVWCAGTMNLVKRVAVGDREALEQLYLSYKTKVFRLALAILGDCFLAEDTVQETFLKIQQSAEGFHFRNSEGAWIMTIARNTAIDILRKRRREVVHEEIEELLDNVWPPANTIELNENEGFLELIRKLNETDQQIVSLHLIGELKHHEIAHILDMNVAAVKKRYRRAIEKIAREMEEHHE